MEQKKRALKIDSVLVCLGRAVEMIADGKRYKWTIKDGMNLYSPPGGKKLFILNTQKKPISGAKFRAEIAETGGRFEKGLALYKEWHECEPASGSLMTPPRGFLFSAGRVESLEYNSTKYTGRKTNYIHTFKSCPLVWVNNKKAPKVLVLTGGKIRVKNEGITG